MNGTIDAPPSCFMCSQRGLPGGLICAHTRLGYGGLCDPGVGFRVQSRRERGHSAVALGLK